ncbi:hypothetical protein GAY31_30670 [Azospirillum brasilense]|nr:hypothetical protein [Azospirillum brasilense]
MVVVLKGLRGIVAITGATLIVGMAFLMSAVVGERSRTQLEQEIGRSLSEAAYQMAEKLDADMWARSNQVSVELCGNLGDDGLRRAAYRGG